jgi:hypothetical protein
MAQQPILRLSMSINIIYKEGHSVKTCSDMDYSLAYVNRVLFPAGITVSLRGCRVIPYLENSDPEGLENEESFHRDSLMDPGADINVFVIPTIPSNDGTLAYTRFFKDERYIVIGETVYDGEKVYIRFQPGRFSNMLVHEVGHLLGLEHVDTRGSLMYPSQLKDIDPQVGGEEFLSTSEINSMRSYIRSIRSR